jgi:large subunit ribosomal protein L29
MKQSEVKEFTVAELQEELQKNRKLLSDLKMTHAISPLDNPIQIQTVRRTVARLATELTKRELQ